MSNQKTEAFNYFSSKIDDAYRSVFGGTIDPIVKNTELYKQKLLYFSCLFDKSLFKTFNNWESWEKGPVEIDVNKLFNGYDDPTKPPSLPPKIGNKIDKAVSKFFRFLQTNDCKQLASNKDGLSELSHRLKSWGAARYRNGSPQRNPMDSMQGDKNALEQLATAGKLQHYNTVRF